MANKQLKELNAQLVDAVKSGDKKAVSEIQKKRSRFILAGVSRDHRKVNHMTDSQP
jgi:uncharacterized membrane protein (DUF106 family)